MYQIPPQRNEAHICRAHNGHLLSTDCWCEPALIYWRTNIFGVKVLVIEHNDTEDLSMHHLGVLLARNRAQDWVTRYLDHNETQGD